MVGTREGVDRLIRALVAVGLEPEAEEVAESLWLTAQCLRVRGTASERLPAKSEPSIAPPSAPTAPPSLELPSPGAASASVADRYQAPAPSPAPTVALHRHEPARAGAAEDEQLPASPFRAPGVAPLPHALHLSRALRPLRRRIPSRRAHVLDLDATVQQIADRDIWLPVTRPRPEPWLDLDLWVDDSPSMVVWRPVVQALRRLLLRQDAFGRIRLLTLRRTAKGPAVFDELGRHQRIDPPTANPLRRRVLWVLSDCVADDWDGAGPIADLLRDQARRIPVALVQMLPQRMWPHSALGTMPRTSLRAVAPALPNARLAADLSDWPTGALKLPVITLDPHALRTWGALIDGRRGIWCAGLVFQPCAATSRPVPAAAPDDAERLAAFRAFASPEARNLAQDLSVLPLNLPIIRLAQQVLVGRAGRLTQLAEVFLGGILERMDQHLAPTERETDPDRIPFDLVGTLRERLLADLPPDEVRRIDARMAAAVEQRLGQVGDFFALIAQDGGTLRLPLDERALPFARIRLKVLQRLGGSYLERAAALQERIQAWKAKTSGSGTGSRPVADVLLISRDPVTAEALHVVYRERSGADPEPHEHAGLAYEDLGSINGARVLHRLLAAGDDLDAAKVDIDRTLDSIHVAAVIELGIASGANPRSYNPGDLLIAEETDDDSDLDSEVQTVATPRLTESFRLAQRNWQGVRVHHGLLWQSVPAPASDWLLHHQDAALESRPAVAPACAERRLAWIAVRGLSDLLWEPPPASPASVSASCGADVAHFVLHTLELVPFAPTFFRDRFQDGSATGPEMVWLPGGNFRMGSPEGVGNDDERPAHEVSLSHYALGKHPVTVGEFRRFVEATQYRTEAEQGAGAWVWNKGTPGQKPDASWRNPYMAQGDNHPAVCVSWNDAKAYCEWLGRQTGQTYGLLTEAQWEHACRAGNDRRYCYGDDETQLGDYAWYDRNAGEGTRPVCGKRANPWGLHDLHGNCWEWCQDWYEGYSEAAAQDPSGPESGSGRVVRGGSWGNHAGGCRSAFRGRNEPSDRLNDLGFRLSRTGPLHSYPFTLGRGDESEPTPEPIPNLQDPLADGTEGPAMVWLPGGTFTMGQDDSQRDEEKPAHPVRVGAFSIGQYPVTFAEYDRFCAATDRRMPSEAGWGRGQRPAILVNWDDAQAYCDWLSGQTGETYRLATEAEWEYACRAGTTTRWSCGDDEARLGDHAWYGKNAGSGTHPVGEKQPNPWHLHDMHGNVWEWCQDWYSADYYKTLVNEPDAGTSGDTVAASGVQLGPSDAAAGSSASRNPASEDPSGPESGSRRVVRGGSWDYHADDCRSAFRFRSEPSYRGNSLGFRLSRTGSWPSHPITLGGVQPMPTAEHDKPRPADPAQRGSSEPGPAPTPEPLQGFRDRFVIVRRDGREEPVDAPELVHLPGGIFRMGDDQGGSDERPVHRVRLPAFALGRTPVTWGDYRRFCEATDGHWPEWLEAGSQYHLETGGDDYYAKRGVGREALDLPVVGVSRADARAYCEWLRERTGKPYRLPTEAEWEYACRAETQTRWSFGDDEAKLGDYAWYAANSEGRLHPIAQKRPNPWGLYDMHGNVWEWCADWYASDYYEQLASAASKDPIGRHKSKTGPSLVKRISSALGIAASGAPMDTTGAELPASEGPSGPESGSIRVVRGGSWNDHADGCRSAYRDGGGPSDRGSGLGFRLSRTV